MLGELTGKYQTDGSLDFSRTENSLVVVTNKATSFRSDLLKGVVNQRVQNRDGSLADSNLGVDLLEDTNNVRGVRLDSLRVSLDNLLSGDALLNDFLSCHFDLNLGYTVVQF